MMKRQKLLPVFALTVLIVAACMKDKKTAPVINSSSQSIFRADVGAPILRAKAQKMINRFAQANGKALTYTFKAAYLLDLIKDTNTVVCIAFYFVETQKGILDILPIAVSKQGYLVKNDTVTSALGYRIAWTKAKELRSTYTGYTKARIFGKNTIDRLVAAGTETVLIELGMEENTLYTDIFLSNAVDVTSEFEEDGSMQCPPKCPEEVE